MLNSINSVGASTYVAPTSGVSASQAPQQSEGLEFSYNPQDELVMDPQTITVPNASKGGRAPESEHVRLGEDQVLKPNKEGQYVYNQGTPQYIAAHTMGTVQSTVNALSEKFGQDISWAFGERQIEVNPDAGMMLNAYYSRDDGSLNFFHATDPVTRQQVFSGSSGEIVSHEAGHAILDAIKPGWLSTWQADTNGLHEAFGDLTGLFMASQNDAVCELAAKETGGDLRKPNCLSATGELLGQTINNDAGQNATGGTYVRTLINDFCWQAPHTVDPKPSGTDPLTTEMHSWSRIFSGAQYDLMTAMTARNMEGGMEAAQAIKKAGSDCMTLLAGGIKKAPDEDASYRDVALGMLQTDRELGGANQDLIFSTMRQRNILFEGDDQLMSIQSAPQPRREMTVTLEGPEFGKFSGAEVTGTVSAGPSIQSGNPGQSLIDNMKMHIQNGSILYTEPNQKVEHKDLFDKDGRPYVGVVRWVDGKMTIERNTMIS